MIFLPLCNFSHVPGGLNLIASLTEDLKIIPYPLIIPHGDWPDEVQYVVMMVIHTFTGVLDSWTVFLQRAHVPPFSSWISRLYSGIVGLILNQYSIL